MEIDEVVGKLAVIINEHNTHFRRQCPEVSKSIRMLAFWVAGSSKYDSQIVVKLREILALHEMQPFVADDVNPGTNIVSVYLRELIEALRYEEYINLPEQVLG